MIPTTTNQIDFPVPVFNNRHCFWHWECHSAKTNVQNHFQAPETPLQTIPRPRGLTNPLERTANIPVRQYIPVLSRITAAGDIEDIVV